MAKSKTFGVEEGGRIPWYGYRLYFYRSELETGVHLSLSGLVRFHLWKTKDSLITWDTCKPEKWLMIFVNFQIEIRRIFSLRISIPVWVVYNKLYEVS